MTFVINQKFKISYICTYFFTFLLKIFFSDKTKTPCPGSSYTSLYDPNEEKIVCQYCHNRLPSCTHQLNLTPFKTDTQYNNSPPSFSASLSRHEDRLNCSQSFCAHSELKRQNLACNVITTSTNSTTDNNDINVPNNSNNNHLRNKCDTNMNTHAGSESYFDTTTYRSSGNRGMRKVNQRTVSVPTVSTNSCQTSLIPTNKTTTNSDGHFETITEDKNTGGEVTVANELTTRRSINSNNASQIISDPRSRTCCFCWCCCCSCSCMRVRTNLGESKRPSASNDPQSTIDGPVGDEKTSMGKNKELKHLHNEFIFVYVPILSNHYFLANNNNDNLGGQKTFREFLRSEYSEENIMFWLACEDIRKENNPEIVEEKARIIYEDFISILSPREVSFLLA
ncbi:unnamed protein product [Trichobilharzia regenti]|nr:unnamed protein product [Trichobilharzia regenti]